jgi:hypothetical protein
MPLLCATALALTLLLGAYVGAYFALVSPKLVRPTSTIILAGRTYQIRTHSITFKVPVDIGPEYGSFLGEQAAWLFAPIHALDRRLRPHVWLTTSPPIGP